VADYVGMRINSRLGIGYRSRKTDIEAPVKEKKRKAKRAKQNFSTFDQSSVDRKRADGRFHICESAHRFSK